MSISQLDALFVTEFELKFTDKTMLLHAHIVK